LSYKTESILFVTRYITHNLGTTPLRPDLYTINP